MPETSGRFRWVVRVAYAGMILGLAVLAVLLVHAVASATVTLLDQWSWINLVGAAAGVLAILLAGLALVLVYGVVRVVASAEDGMARAVGRLSRIESLLGDQTRSARELVRLGGLSDHTKSVVYRQRELEVVRDTFNDALLHQEYDACQSLIEIIQDKPGYAGEAERLRRDLDDSRRASEAEKINAAVQRVREIISMRDWPRATRAAEKVKAMFPGDSRTANLPEQVQSALTDHKRALLHAFDEAVKKNDVDSGVDLLKQLDQYLSPQEAAALEESARGVFRAKLHNLGVQFALCVTDARWSEAIAVGEQIIREYPNSRMANEVNEKMGQLRARAAG